MSLCSLQLCTVWKAARSRCLQTGARRQLSSPPQFLPGAGSNSRQKRTRRCWTTWKTLLQLTAATTLRRYTVRTILKLLDYLAPLQGLSSAAKICRRYALCRVAQEAEKLRRALRRLRQTCVGQGPCEANVLNGASCLARCFSLQLTLSVFSAFKITPPVRSSDARVPFGPSLSLLNYLFLTADREFW